MNYDEMERESERHALAPEVGDYWHDHFCPVYAVVDVGPYHVTVLHETKQTDAEHWTWDISKVRTFSRREFNDKVRYRGISETRSSVADKCWVNCSPRRMADFAPHALAAASPTDAAAATSTRDAGNG